MQMESLLSFMFLVLIISPIIASMPERHIDYSLYQLQLAQDSWRVLYLRGDFSDLKDQDRYYLESEFDLIRSQTGFCIFMEGITFTNCRDGEPHPPVTSISRTIFYDHQPKNVTFSLRH